MAEPRSISVKQVTEAAQKAAAHVAERQNLGFLKPPYTVGFFPPLWFGFVMREADEKMTLTQMNRVAADAFKEIAGHIQGIDTVSKPGLHVDTFGRLITVGFMPQIDVHIKG